MIKLLIIVGIVIGLVLIYIILISLVPGFKTQVPALSRGKATSESGTVSTLKGRLQNRLGSCKNTLLDR